jgi:hypothetical protein
MRLLLLAALVAVGVLGVDATSAAVGVPLVTSDATAVCGGGGPGEPCSCPSTIPVLNKPTGIVC